MAWEGDDILLGLAGNDTLQGYTGNDTLTGGAGTNRVDGYTGDDLIIGGVGIDNITGGTGTDTVDYSASGAGINLNLDGNANTGGDAAGDLVSGVEHCHRI